MNKWILLKQNNFFYKIINTFPLMDSLWNWNFVWIAMQFKSCILTETKYIWCWKNIFQNASNFLHSKFTYSIMFLLNWVMPRIGKNTGLLRPYITTKESRTTHTYATNIFSLRINERHFQTDLFLLSSNIYIDI